jgi:bacterioferritin-associated ferredoxin
MAMMTQCCVCKKIRYGEIWKSATEAPTAHSEVEESLSHGYCQDCAKVVFQEMQQQRAEVR